PKWAPPPAKWAPPPICPPPPMCPPPPRPKAKPEVGASARARAATPARMVDRVIWVSFYEVGRLTSETISRSHDGPAALCQFRVVTGQFRVWMASEQAAQGRSGSRMKKFFLKVFPWWN